MDIANKAIYMSSCSPMRHVNRLVPNHESLHFHPPSGILLTEPACSLALLRLLHLPESVKSSIDKPGLILNNWNGSVAYFLQSIRRKMVIHSSLVHKYPSFAQIAAA